MAESEIGSQLTLLELAKRINNNDILTIVEKLSKRNRILEDAIWIEANQPTSHVFTERIGEPSGTWRKINAGVAAEASQTRQIVEAIGMLESYSKVDAALVMLAKNKKKFRQTEDMAFLQGLNKTFATAIIYGDATLDPEKFTGFKERYDALALDNVIGGSGTGSDLSSIWIIRWDEEDGCFLVYPSESPTLGLKATDLGEDTVADSNSNEYQAFRTHFELYAGLCVKDARSVGRICNIETAGAANIFDEDDLINMLNKFIDLNNTVIYCNRTIKAQMDINAKDKNNVNYSIDTVWGRPTTHFQGIPVKLTEAILDTEEAVT